MIELLKEFSLAQILTVITAFVVCLSGFIKLIIDISKWISNFLENNANQKIKKNKTEELLNEIQKQNAETAKREKQLEQDLEKMTNSLQSVLDQMTAQNATQNNNMEDIRIKQDKMSQDIASLGSKVDVLMGSDLEDIKSFILSQHRKFSKLGHIDTQSLNCCESRYKYYTLEHGNSFVKGLMEKIRQLPIQD